MAKEYRIVKEKTVEGILYYAEYRMTEKDTWKYISNSLSSDREHTEKAADNHNTPIVEYIPYTPKNNGNDNKE